MSFNIQSADARDNFRNAAHLIAQANGKTKPNPKGPAYPPVADIGALDLTQLTQGYLFTCCDVNPQTQQMQFTIIDTQQVSNSPVIPMMRLLAMQDSFVVTSMSYFLMIYPYLGGNQQNPDFSGFNYLTPYTYPSATHNFEQSILGSQIMDPGMSLFWNPGSYLSIEVDKKLVIPYWPCLRHLYIPQTQANATPIPAQGPPFQWPFTQDQFDGATDSAYPVEPTVIFGGGRQNIVKLNLPNNVPGTITPFTLEGYGTTFVVKACLYFNGILAQNSTSVK